MRGAAVLLLVGLLAGLAAGIAWAGRGQEQPEAQRGQSVNICHAAGNGKYVSNSPDVDSIVSGQGHGGHPEDIIPPFDYDPKGDESGHYPGQNWNDEGQAIHENGCVAPDPPDPPNCNATDVAAADSSGSGRNQFQQGDSVYFRAEHFPPGSTGTFSVTHNKSGSVVASGGFSTGSGEVVVFAWNGANAFEGDEGYRIEASADGCSDGDNFQYRVEGPPSESLKLHVRKVVVGSDLPPAAFSFEVAAQTTSFEADGLNELTLPAGRYTVTEPPVAGFTTTTSGCTGVVLSSPQSTIPVCTITNTADDVPLLRLQVRKVVVGSSRPPSDFSFRIAGRTIRFEADGANEGVVPAGTYTVTEVPAEGFRTTTSGCTGIVIESPQPQIPVCTITNTASTPAQYPLGTSLKCVDNAANGTYSATFGYYNPNPFTVTVEPGGANNVSPGGPYHGQPTTFLAGTVPSAFTIADIPAARSVTWTLANAPPASSSTTAQADFPTKCTPDPPPTPADVSVFVTCVVNGATTYDATFGYQNAANNPVSIPVGPQNRFDPDPLDRGQPAEFVPGTVRSAVTVQGIPNATSLTWTILPGNDSRTGSTIAEAGPGFGTKCGPEPPDPPDPPDPPVPPDPPDPPTSGPNPDPVGVFVRCVTNRGSTYDAVFGYQNDNEDLVEIAVGSQNRFLPTPQGRGQTTDFLPGNHQEAFTVTGIQSGALLAWAVTHAGATRTATAASNFPEKCAEPEPPSQPIGIFGCVIDHGDTYDAVFGYENDNPVDISVQIGVANFVLPKPVNRGQPTLFSPGRHEDAFRVRGVPNDRLVAWSLSYRGTRFAAVSSTYPVHCSGSEKPRPVEIAPLCIRRDGATYTAVFSYANLSREDVIVPVGSGNHVAPAPVDQGQPTVFRAGIVPFAFAVRDVPVGRDVTWTVASAGQVDTARASANLGRDCSLVSIEGNADLDLTKVARPDSVDVGQRIEYTITVHNAGTTPVFAPVVLDRPLDGRVQLLSAASAAGHCRLLGHGTRAQRVRCVLRDIAADESATIVVAARALEPGRTVNRATVLSLPPPSNGDNTDTASVVIRARQRVSPGEAGPKPKPPFTG